MNKWTFAELQFDGWEHNWFSSKQEAIEEGRKQFDDQFSFYVGRLEDMGKHEIIVDAEKVTVN